MSDIILNKIDQLENTIIAIDLAKYEELTISSYTYFTEKLKAIALIKLFNSFLENYEEQLRERGQRSGFEYMCKEFEHYLNSFKNTAFKADFQENSFCSGEIYKANRFVDIAYIKTVYFFLVSEGYSSPDKDFIIRL